MKKIVIILVLLLNCLPILAHWYNKNTAYYKLTTHRTGLSKVVASDLPNGDKNSLHLIYRGSEISYYVAENGDLIYCIPSVSILDEYSNDFVVYLYFGADGTNNNLLYEANTVSDTIKYGWQSIYLESDKQYFAGYDNLEYDRSRFEDWYWKILSDYPSYTGIQHEKNAELIISDLYLFANKDSSVNIVAHLATPVVALESSIFNAKRQVSFWINNDSVSVILFDTLVDNLAFDSDVMGNKLFSGLNEFRLFNRTADTAKNNYINIAVNDINISGYFKPYFYVSPAYQSNKINVGTSNIPLQYNSLLTINGFADSVLYLYDSVSNSFLIKNNKPVTHIAVNTKCSNPLTNIVINNMNYNSADRGIHIVILRNGANAIDTSYFQSYNQEVLKLLDGVSNNDIVCIAMNGVYDVNNNMKIHLSTLGLSAINDYNGGDAYICSYKKGTMDFMEDLNKVGKFCSEDVSFYDESKRWFAADVNLIGSKYYSLVYSDNKNINVATITKSNSTDLRNIETEAELIIIYHKDFSEKSKEYANYRRSRGVKVECVDADDIYKEFGYGNKSPYDIKDFLRYAYNYWQGRPKYVLFIGDASTDPRLCDTSSRAIDYIPTFGNPASDYWFGIFEAQTHNSELVIGRIPCSNNIQLENYIEKVKVYESSSSNMWNKQFMFVNGGNTSEEVNIIKDCSNKIAQNFSKGQMCIDTISFDKGTGAGTDEHKNDIIRVLNSGAMLTMFHGHGSTTSFDNWGWQVDNLNNINKYGILTTMSCNTGAFAEPKGSTVNEDFILSYGIKGFVAALGATTTTTIGSNYYLQNNISNALNTGHRRIGDIIKYAKKELNYISGDRFQKVMEYNFSILGDPMLEFKIDTLPDIYALSNEVAIINESGDTNITDKNTTVTIKIPIHNAGIMYESGFNVLLESDGKNYSTKLYDVCKTQEVEFTIPLNTTLYEQKVTIILDSDNEIIENNKDNNVITKTIRILNNGLYPIEPLPNMVMNKNNLHFRFMKWQSIYNEKYDFYLFDSLNNMVYNSKTDEIYYNMEYVDWKPQTDLLLYDGNYFVQVKQYSSDSLVSEKTIPFMLSDSINKCDICAELVFMSENTGLDTSYYLRGDTAFIKIELANISLRTAIENVVVDVGVNQTKLFNKTIEKIEPNSNIKFIIPILTDSLEVINNINISIVVADLYDFNNTYMQLLNVEEDTIKPNMEIYFDNDLIDTNVSKYISANPNIKIILTDNSNLPVLIAEPISVRINGLTVSEELCSLKRINKGKIKAELDIKPPLLTEKENLFRFVGIDGSGNPQTITYKLSIAVNNNILSHFVAPNPVDYGDVSIICELLRSEISGKMSVDIFDIFGKKVKNLSENIYNRKNSIIWNQLDNNGNKVAQGTYYYVLEILGENWIEPAKGKIQIVK